MSEGGTDSSGRPLGPDTGPHQTSLLRAKVGIGDEPDPERPREGEQVSSKLARAPRCLPGPGHPRTQRPHPLPDLHSQLQGCGGKRPHLDHALQSGGSCRCHPCQGTPSRLPVSTAVARQFSRQSQALGLLELPQFSKLASAEERALRALLLWSTRPVSRATRPRRSEATPGARHGGARGSASKSRAQIH